MRKIRLFWIYFGQYLLILAFLVCPYVGRLAAAAGFRDDEELRMYAEAGSFIVGLLALWWAIRWRRPI